MRSEKEMMELILNIAMDDERIRAVVLNGSRANPNAPKDLFRDYDIVYIVTQLEPFVDGHTYIEKFGEVMMLQMPETMRDPLGDGRFTYLALFADGNRIDLQIYPLEKMGKLLEDSSQTITLLDKDNILPNFPPASDRSYFVEAPTKIAYDSCCNNFWWCLQNVAKGIWRDELPYAMEMYNHYVREELNQMVDWYIGGKYSYQISTGKQGKYYKRLLEPEYYQWYKETYANGEYNNFWDSIFIMGKLFGILGRQVGSQAGYQYNCVDEEKMLDYLFAVRHLPTDAAEFRMSERKDM